MARPERDVQAAVLQLLRNLNGLEALKELFWSQLNYDRVNEPLSHRQWPEPARQALVEAPVLFASGGEGNAFHVVYCRLTEDRLLLGLERPVITQLLRDHPYALFVFSDQTRHNWHFVNVKYAEDEKKRRVFRRITIGPHERLRTASERMSMLDLSSIGGDLFGLSPLAIQQRHDDAFDVEAVTKQFFDEYKAVFDILQNDLAKQAGDRVWAHDFALQFLSRCMFLYFVQRKRWLGDAPEFLATFWEAYNNARQPKDSFFSKWLKVLFFEAFNNACRSKHPQFPKEIDNVLAEAPYLNGGLFIPNDLDRKTGFTISDVRFKQVFTFLERFNFTIAEDSPLDQEVAVDPEMLGKVYEGLVNLPGEADKRGEAGIFYTPRTEIDLMCRLAFVDNLANHLGEEHKNLFYEAIFALEADEKEAADKALSRARLWPAVDKHLREIAIVDPVCGSGSFLVGMLNILDDLGERAARQLGRSESAFERKKRIIGQNLYGVDVMEWASHVAELRLWLALVVDAELTPYERKSCPLLPNLTFKIRVGDSLVQEVAGLPVELRADKGAWSDDLRRDAARLVAEKLAHYSSTSGDHSKAVQILKTAIFKKMIEDRVKGIKQQIAGLDQAAATRQTGLGFHREELGAAETKRQEAFKEQKAEFQARQRQLCQALQAARDGNLDRFVWELDFPEVFIDRDGFDVVIGNPPYVERHKIRDPFGPLEAPLRLRNEYKARLARSVHQAWPAFFAYRPSTNVAARRISAMSDLYSYFYFHGLSLLNAKGSFCFITSNSWLDVGYGKDLQEFLLRCGHVKMVIDNEVKRSFASADVNTVIVLLARPDDRREDGLQRTARFVMFKAPFEQVLSPIIFEEIEDGAGRKSTAEYRLCCVTQDALFEDGCETLEEDGDAQEQTQGKKAPRSRGPLIEVAKYIGNKWGGKYLRAPDIYHMLRERRWMVTVGDLATARLGVTTGANEFFFVRRVGPSKFLSALGGDEKEVRLPDEYVRPVVRTVSECVKMTFRSSDTDWRVIVFPEKVTDRGAQSYLREAERLGVPDRPFFRGKRKWYCLSTLPSDLIAVPEIVFRRYFFLWNEGNCVLNKNFYGYVPRAVSADLLWAILNCTFSFLQFELHSRKPGAGASGIGVGVANRILVLSPGRLSRSESEALERAGKSLRGLDIVEVEHDVLRSERRRIDEIVFDVLKLTTGEQEGMYEALIALVNGRAAKAESV